MATDAVSIRGLDFAFGAHPVLQGVDTTIAAGNFVSIVGPNGGGKSTLLKLILGLLRPDHGTVRVFGESPDRARRRLGYMTQHAHVDPRFPVTVRDVVLMGRLSPARRIGPYRGRDGEVADRSLAETGVLELRDRPFSSLSGGQRQRVLIARALACEPEMLMLDEPTASLDPGVQDDLYELLHRLNARMTVVLVSHDVSVVSRYVDQILCVSGGGVETHAASAISGALVDLYGSSDLALVRHDHGPHDHDEGHDNG